MQIPATALLAVGLSLSACQATGAPETRPVTPPEETLEALELVPDLTLLLLAHSEAPSLTLADVFSARDPESWGLDPARLRTLIATGDVIPARYTDVVIRSRGDDFLYPVAAIKETTAAADLTLTNLEAPLIRDCPYHASGFTFCGRPGFATALQVAGVDVATLENNHVRNYGPQGVAETIAHLQASGIAWADRGTPAVLEVRGLTFGFIAFNAVGERIDKRAMAEQIRALRGRADILVAAFHWGAEYVSLPERTSPASDDPREVAHEAVNAGADLVIGNHPHWVQGVELYDQKLIVYAHGNLIFDQMWSYDTRVSVIGRYTFYDRLLVGVEFMPTLSMNYAQPVLLDGAEAQAILDRMKDASDRLALGSQH